MLASCSPATTPYATPLLLPLRQPSILLRRRHWFALAAYPLLSFFSPSEAYLFEFLERSKGFTPAELVGSVLPVWTYGTFACLPAALACSDLLGHKRTVVLGALARLAAAAIIVLVPRGDVLMMQVDQVCFAFFFVAKTTVLPALLFEVLPPSEYQRAISVVRMCVLVGSAASAVGGQLLVACDVRLRVLAYITLGCHSAGFCVSLLLPARRLDTGRCGEYLAWGRRRLSAGGDASHGGAAGADPQSSAPSGAAGMPRLDMPRAVLDNTPRSWPAHGTLGVRRAIADLWHTARSQRDLRLACLLLWYVVLAATQQLMLTYYQALFAVVSELDEPARPHAPRAADDPSSRWNGLVLGGSYVLGSLACALAAHPAVEGRVLHHAPLVSTAASALGAVLLGALGEAAHVPDVLPRLPSAYVLFTLCQALFEFTRTASVAQIAVLLDAAGCRHFLSALVACQLAISLTQAVVQLTVRGVTVDALRHFRLLAYTAAAVAALLAVLACIDGCIRWRAEWRAVHRGTGRTLAVPNLAHPSAPALMPHLSAEALTRAPATEPLLVSNIDSACAASAQGSAGPGAHPARPGGLPPIRTEGPTPSSSGSELGLGSYTLAPPSS